MAEQIRTARLVVEALDRALADLHGRSVMSGSEVVDRLLELRTVVDDIGRVEALEAAPGSPDRRTRFLLRHPHPRNTVPDRG
jgi:hypothetical protein